MSDARRDVEAALASGHPTAWFERLYAAARDGEVAVPWDRGGEPRPLLADWARPGAGRAIVVGCGLGADAELFAGLGYAVTAFDISPTAIELARARFPGSRVDYWVADLLDLPAGWQGAFDLVVESLTVQSLPDDVRPRAIAAVSALVAPGGTLLVVATRREGDGPVAGPPWPLTRAEVDSFATGDLRTVRVEAIGREWRAELRRDGGASPPRAPG